MIVALDATPLIGQQTGVGRYVANLVPHLAQLDDVRVVLVPFTLRGRRRIPPLAGVTIQRRPAPARLLRAAWVRSDFPQVEIFAGRCDVFHGTNFVLPPRWRAAGVVTIHDLSYLQFPETVTPDVRQYRELVPRALGTGAIVATPSRAVADEVRDAYGLPEDRVYVTPLGVGPEWFTAAPPDPELRMTYRLPEEYLLFLGTKGPRKNLSTLLAAHARAVTANPDALPLLLVGSRARGTPSRKQQKVHALGHVPDSDLHRIVAGSSALLAPSRYEGFGLPLLEALACGVLVVASDIPVHREVAGDQACYIPAMDIDAWTDVLMKDDLLRTGEKASRQAHARHFTWEACARATRDTYERSELHRRSEIAF
jgi:glycosyltransferase involved in cell wall biosynthesis